MTQEALKLALEEIQKYEKETGEKLTLRANKLVLEPDELTIAYMSGLYDGKKAQRTWVELTEEELRTAFGKLYPNDIGILELAENNRDYAVEAIGARHHWTAFKAGARAGEAKLKEKNI